MPKAGAGALFCLPVLLILLAELAIGLKRSARDSLLQSALKEAGSARDDAINKTMQEKIDKLMIRTVAFQQLRLFELLDQADADLNATEKRLQTDLLAAKEQVQAQKDVANQTAFANTIVGKNEANLKMMAANFPGTEHVAKETEKKIQSFNKTIADTKTAIKKSGAWVGAKMRADEGTNTLKLMHAKLEEIEKRTEHMEDQLYDGNETQLVNEHVESKLTGIIEDLGRGLVRQLPA
eukprot:gnl/TRDRNA2_/TRDRNA2_180196_c0_seq1.p1 gnl/TRDRNA2_/TRDRNA2_180196_c0~~gnl/TRDRNA2_/TRDRNA2_180196_c0_seq1.p1  ORF type:complete len:237 (+),score=71.82 gnl/TRDRNA2_/TRDRNA2_180196_c0_seq1:188-898(+)